MGSVSNGGRKTIGKSKVSEGTSREMGDGGAGWQGKRSQVRDTGTDETGIEGGLGEKVTFENKPEGSEGNKLALLVTTGRVWLQRPQHVKDLRSGHACYS